MQNLMSLLNKKYKYHLRYAHAVEVISNNWNDIVKDLSLHIQPVNIYKNQLVVECANPIWLSEIDYFKNTIIDKIHLIFKEKKIKINLESIKPIYHANKVSVSTKSSKNIPQPFEDRISWNIKLKQQTGAILCESCEKIWDTQKICRLCQLTSS